MTALQSIFSNTFLLEDGNTSVLRQDGVPDELTRKKKSHKKSRLGCLNCRQRKVKCDETYPCRNCTKRSEVCTQRRVSRPATTVHRDPAHAGIGSPNELGLRPLSSYGGQTDASVNLLHMELFYHFEHVTAKAMCFSEFWPIMLQRAFTEEFLMSSMLSVAATHLWTLRPDSPRYARASMVLLSKCLTAFRENLDRPITAENCDPVLGTAMLIHHLAWSNTRFLDDQPAAERSSLSSSGSDDDSSSPSSGHVGGSSDPAADRSLLDLSSDQLFLLSSGVRQVFFVAMPLFLSERSTFREWAKKKNCSGFEWTCEQYALDWRTPARRFMARWRDPRWAGSSGDGGVASAYQTPPRSVPSRSSSSFDSPCSSGSASSPVAAAAAAGVFSPSDMAHVSSGALFFADERFPEDEQEDEPKHVFTVHPFDIDFDTFQQEMARKTPRRYTEAEQRESYERVAVRLSVALAYLKAGDGGPSSAATAAAAAAAAAAADPSAAGLFPGAAGGAGEAGGYQIPRPSDVQKFYLSFPMLCFGAFLPLIRNGDARALLVLYHLYDTSLQLLTPEEGWWCLGRARIMKDLIRRDLEARGLSVDLY